MSTNVLDLWWHFVPSERSHLALPDPAAKLSHHILDEMEALWEKNSNTKNSLFQIAKTHGADDAARSAAILAILFVSSDISRNDDHARAMILAAALQENPVAIAMHVDALRMAHGRASDVSRAMTIHRALRYWESKLHRSPHINCFRKAFSEAESCLNQLARETSLRASGTAVFFHEGQAKLQVITEVGDAESREGKELARLYASLTKPLPLKSPALTLNVLADQLLFEFPWLEDLVASLIGKLKLRASVGQSWMRLPPLLLVGPPGCGKTRFAQRFAKLAGCGHQTLSVGGSSDNRMLAGTARGWSSMQPCLPLVAMRQQGSANPLIIVDEIDKAVVTHNGSLHATLLSLLEQETARGYFDECLLVEANLGEVSWVATANGLSGIPEPLLNRLHIEKIAMPGVEHLGTIVEAFRRDIAADLGVSEIFLPELERPSYDRLQQAFANGASLRTLKRAVAASMEIERWQPVLH